MQSFCFLVVYFRIISTDNGLSDSIYDEHYAWFHHVVQGMKSIIRNDAEPRKATTEQTFILKFMPISKRKTILLVVRLLSESAETKRKHKHFLRIEIKWCKVKTLETYARAWS